MKSIMGNPTAIKDRAIETDINQFMITDCSTLNKIGVSQNDGKLWSAIMSGLNTPAKK